MPAASGPLIVLADDTDSLRLLLRRVLENAGFRVQDFADGQAALEACRTLKPAVLVTDIHMPAMHGTEVLRRLRVTGDLTPALVISSHLDDATARDCLAHPNVAVLAKPFPLEDFQGAVETLVRKASGAGA